MILTFNLDPALYRLTPQLAISFYGICLALGIGLFNYYAELDLKKNLTAITDQQLSKIHLLAVLGAILGARLLWAINEIWQKNTINLYEFIAVWRGGFSILGALIGSLIIIPYLQLANISIKRFLASVLIYLPIAQALGRIGCLFVGCCHGGVAMSDCFLSIIYTHPDSLAPCFVSLYPTQLYSSLFYIFLFLVLLFFKRLNNDGMIIKIYFLSALTERFLIDFWRGDRQIITNIFGGLFSSNQLIAMLIISFMVILIISDGIQKKFINRTRSRQ
jgi:phosphatidylglycerol:prolipoprotein diacylglycerol transferase